MIQQVGLRIIMDCHRKKHGLISIGVYPFVSKEYNGNVLWC